MTDYKHISSLDPTATTVLWIKIQRPTIPVFLWNMYKIVNEFGRTLRMITFMKNDIPQVLCEMASLEETFNVMQNLQGRNVYTGCCLLYIKFSYRGHLVVRKNHHMSWNFEDHPITPEALEYYLTSVVKEKKISFWEQRDLKGNQSPDEESVVVVNNFLKKETTIHQLFVLFGVYGDVQRIKILFRERGPHGELGRALIQYKFSLNARHAVIHLNGCPLNGKKIIVERSKFPKIIMPNKNNKSNELAQDYKDSIFHRFKNRMYMNPKNMNMPSQILHVANLYEGATEEQLRNLFRKYQRLGEKPIVEFFKSSRRMAYIDMADVESGVIALVHLHNYKLGDDNYSYPIRVSFSNRDPSSLVNSDAYC